MKLIPKPHQVKAAKELHHRLLKYGIALLFGEVRSGKTLSFIYCAAELLKLKKVLIITKKDAIDDIKSNAPTNFIVTNFEQVKNLPLKDFELIVIDEFHRKVSSAEPKFNKRKLWQEIREVVYFTPVIFASGTPTPETYASIFSALALSSQSPFNKYKSFKDWFNDYGVPTQIVRGYDHIKRKSLYAPCYKKAQTRKIKKVLEPYIVTITQKEAGHKYFAKDKLIKIPLSHRQERIYDELDKHKLYELPNDYSIVCDKANIHQKKHQISGGFCKTQYDFNESINGVYKFRRLPKVDYILNNYDPGKIVIFCFYIAEQEYLSKLFPHVYSITKKAEGTDFSDFEKMVIYSFGFHAVTYEQIRARQMNFNKRKSEIVIDWLLSGIDEYVYDAVSMKKDFTASWYRNNKKD